MKKRFYVYYSWKEQMELLSTEEKATMLMNLFSFQENKEPILDTPMLKMCWASMKFLLEKDTIEYNNKVERGRNAGQLNHKVPHGAVAVRYDTVQSNVDNDNVNVNVNVNGKVNVKELVNDVDAWDQYMNE